MGQDNDLFEFTDDVKGQGAGESSTAVWKLLIVDDEPEIHAVTRLALRNFQFDERPLEITSAYSAKEAKSILLSQSDFAVALIDVVMESDHAGLELVQWIRASTRNQHIRLVLRTGQAGQAPERDVIENYDINDYKQKTELTADKLYTVMYSSLRTYRDITALCKNVEGLEQIARSAEKIFSHQPIGKLTQDVLAQMCSLIALDHGNFSAHIDVLAARMQGSKSLVLAGEKNFSAHPGKYIEDIFDSLALDQHGYTSAINNCSQVFGNDFFIGVYRSQNDNKHIIYIEGLSQLSDLDKELIQIFGANVGIALDDHALVSSMKTDQTELIYRLGETVHHYAKTEHNGLVDLHEKRVSLTCEVLAEKLHANSEERSSMLNALPKHDMRHMKLVKCDALNNWHENASNDDDKKDTSTQELFAFGSTAMHQAAQMADLWDSLLNERCYKKAWPLSQVLNYLSELSGRKFDHHLVSIVKDSQSELMAIQRDHADKHTNTSPRSKN